MKANELIENINSLISEQELLESSSIEAGKPFTYVRNTTSSKKYKTNQDFGQKIEPSGRYLTHVPDDTVALPGQEKGKHIFYNPLHIPFGGGYTEETNWKHRISKRFENKTGLRLSQAIRNKGYDGIVTHDKYGTSEIVDLSHLTKK